MTFKMSNRVYIAVLVYIAWVAVYLVYDYQKERDLLFQQIDRSLEHAATAVPLLLPRQFHHLDMQAGDIPRQDDLNNTFRLSEYIRYADVVYIYSLVLEDDRLYFTSSSVTDEEMQAGEELYSYFDPYDDADPRLKEIFTTREKVFLEYSDEWGTFRSVFIPLQSVDGRIYLSGADIEISHIENLLQKRLLNQVGLAAVFMLFLGPVMLTFSSTQRRWAREMETSVAERTRDLHQSEKKISSILEHSPVGIFHYDNNSCLTMVNQRMSQIVGSPEEVLLGFRMLGSLKNPELIAALEQALEGNVGKFEGPYTSVTGHRDIYLIAEFVPLFDSNGEVDGGVAVFNDATEQVNTTSNLKKLSMAVEQSPNVVVITDVHGQIEYVNPRFCDITGYAAAEVIGKNPRLLSSGEASPEIYEDLWQTLLAGQEWRGVLHNRKKNGELYWAEEVISPIMDGKGVITHFIALQEDVTEVRRISEEINYQTTHDALTGLLNRRQFEVELERVVAHSNQHGSHHALCFIDIDQFKIINDTCGHMAGDEMLRQISNLIREQVRSRDILARPGGDEFLLLFEHASLAQAERMVQLIMNQLSRFRFQWQERNFPVEVSAGLAVIDGATKDASEAMKEVDTACYSAKDAGRNRIHIYNDEDEQQLTHKGYIQWASEIHAALDEDRFRLFAQQIQPLQQPQASSFEVLIRLLSPSGNLVPPGAFLPAAERYNLAAQIDRWVITHTLKWMTEHLDQLDHIASLSINLSGQSLGDEALLGFIIRSIEHGTVPPQLIKFEITETAAISNLKDAQIFIRTLQGLGCSFALDDFGSGLSSFAYLKNLPVDQLKIDGMFVRDILTDPIDEAMVRSINEIGHIMKMQTIAEFVESEEIRQHLIELGVDFAQGYAIGKPLPIDEILPLSDGGAGDTDLQ